MSLLGDFLGETATALAENVDRTAENKRLLAERLRQEEAQRVENDRQYERARTDMLADEERLLGREVAREYVDETTNEMVTVYKNGHTSRRKLTADEIRERKEAAEDRALRREFMSAQTEAMRGSGSRGSGGTRGGGRTDSLTEWEAEALAKSMVGPEPDTRDAELHAQWRFNVNRAKAALASGAAPPLTKRPLSSIPLVDPVHLPASASGGPRDAVADKIRAGLPAPQLYRPSN